MASRILSRRDLDFMLFEWLKVDELSARPRFAEHSRDTFDAVLDLSAELATAAFAPHNALGDTNEPQFDGERAHVIPEVGEALRAFNNSGLLSGAMDEEVGGAQLPHVVDRACFAWFQAANNSTAGYAMLTAAATRVLLAFATERDVERYATPMIEGRFFGTMCLSEPDAGSSLADIAVRAELQPEGTYRLFGGKMWISGGDHEMSENIVHLVLARAVGAPRGIRGLSLYAVPKYLVEPDSSIGERNDVALAGLNHKMGNRGTTNTVLDFGGGRYRPGGQAGAIGTLIGEENRGLAYMFQMMNEARIGVGAGAAALGYTSFLHAVDYARTRSQGRPVDAKAPESSPVPIIRHADVRRMLLTSKAYVEGAMALVLYAARLLDESETGETAAERDRATILLEVITPIVKSWPSQWCLAANDLAIQVHGGYGYTRDYPLEQFYRDNRLNPIHEGTHGIQALDLLGRKVRINSGRGLTLLLDAIRSTAARAANSDEFAGPARTLTAAAARIEEITALLWADGDPKAALVSASSYLEALGDVVVGWLWLEQVIACGDRDDDFYRGKRLTANYYFTDILPRIHTALDLLEARDQTLVELDDSIL
ncbi:acyl-CoA dehydrogenase [Paenarthrobacter sp. CM16]|uniref:acyl-CoA dehydrogenase n=1 Tax=Paenarthrobacter sp. CM16 TaxID=2738447 RepID=UPI001554D349|nr:acyl-CoA dehydrogenase [Paenarthrobacter sp. CM16]NQD86869.1 acyl-CoA dehydrogenase [Paenarthrobacter sp. CM16]